jgi:DNA-binding beta-propeller fold protein YncE
MSLRFLSAAAACALGVLTVVHGQTASTNRPTESYSYAAGPVAVGIRQGSEAVVLQSDGRAYSMNLTTGVFGTWTYRIPAGYQAVDTAAGVVRGKVVTCFSLNSRGSKQSGSYILQVLDDKSEIWSWMRVPGVYVGLALEPARGMVYVANSSTNEIFGVAIGDRNARPVRIASIAGAGRIGALAIAPSTRRLYVSDMSAPRLYTIELNGGAVKVVDAAVEEARAIAWDGINKRLFIADTGNEAILVIDPNARAPRLERVLSDKRLRDPAGLAVAPDGTLWVADESARSIFQIAVDSRSISRALRWSPPKS